MMNNAQMKLQAIFSALDKIIAPIKKIGGKSRALPRAFKASQDWLAGPGRPQRAIDTFRDLQTAIANAGSALHSTKQRLASFGQRLNEAAAMARAWGTATRKISALKNELQHQNGKLPSLKDKLATTGTGLERLTKHQCKMKADTRRTNAELRTQNTQLKQISERHSRMSAFRNHYSKGRLTGKSARTADLYAVHRLQSLAHPGYQSDALMSDTQAVTRIADKSHPHMQKLREQARTLALTTRFDLGEVAGGQSYLARTGYDAPQILGAMPGMVALAAAGNMSIENSADIAANIQSALGQSAEPMGRLADLLTVVSTRSKVDIPSLGKALQYSAGIGRAHGQTLETMIASNAILGNAGIEGGAAGKAMGAILSRIGNAPALKNLGVPATDKNGNMRDLFDILTDIGKKTSHMSIIEQGEIFEDIADQPTIAALQELIKATQNGQLGTLREHLVNSDGEASRVATVQMDNLKGDVNMLRAALENISVELFEKTAPGCAT